jgi:single-strand DNA-binding protein
MNINKVTIAGRLTRDPELRYTPKGVAVAKLGVAVSREWKSETGEKREESLFVDVDCFGKQAEVVGKHFAKGKEIYIEGRLRLNEGDDKATGQKRSKISIIMDGFQFVGWQQDKPDAPKAVTSPAPKPSSPPPSDDDSDVPF